MSSSCLYYIKFILQYRLQALVVLACILIGAEEDGIWRNIDCVPLLVFGANAAIG